LGQSEAGDCARADKEASVAQRSTRRLEMIRGCLVGRMG
jgi:hypothetical protein